MILLDRFGPDNFSTLQRLPQLVLTLNCFSFAGSYYKQINGVAMGTKMGPSYANLFVGYIEHKFFNQYNGPKPELYRPHSHKVQTKVYKIPKFGVNQASFDLDTAILKT